MKKNILIPIVIMTVSLLFLGGCESQKEGSFLEFEDSSPSNPEIVNKKSFQVVEDQLKADIVIESQGQLAISLYYKALTNHLVIAVHKLKTIIVNPNLKEMFGQAQTGLLVKSDELPQKTQKKSVVAGIPCVIYEIIQKKKRLFEGCVAAFSDLKLSEKEGQTFMKMSEFLGQIMGQNHQDLGGILISTKVYDQNGAMIVNSTLKSFGQKKISEAIFQMPQGYKIEKIQAPIK